MQMKESRTTDRTCKYCGDKIGWFDLKMMDENNIKPYFTNYFTETPWVDKINNVKYYRVVCVKCFYENFNRIPKRPNILSYDFEFLLDVPKEIIRKNLEMRAVTKENLIRKYGEIEGCERWEKYCKLQSITNTYEYKKEKYGMSKEDFDNFNKSRSVTKENLIKRHGEQLGNEIWNNYVEKQRYTKSFEYYQNKYGNDATNKWEYNNSLKALNIDNFVRKYGEELGYKKYAKYLLSSLTGYSNVSQDFFNEIVNQLPEYFQYNTNSIMYGSKNREFGIYDKTRKMAYKYDFVIRDIKYCIEFNGEHVHPNKQVLTVDEWNNWRCAFSKKTADVCYENDVHKKSFLEKIGFVVDIVWYNDYINNKEMVIKNTVDKILTLSKERNFYGLL